jgi:hypothetical protein
MRLFALVVLAGCGSPDECPAMCAAARERYAGCIDAAGQAWGGDGVGYASAADYDDWCATWTWEVRELGEEAQCADKRPIFEDGTCEDYYDAWSGE